VLSAVFKPPPGELRGLITWIAEVRRKEDGNLTFSDEEKGRLALKVDSSYFLFVFWGGDNFTLESVKCIICIIRTSNK